MPDESDVKQILTATPWRTGGDHQDPLSAAWMKTTKQDPKSMNLNLNEAVSVAYARFYQLGINRE